MTFNRLVTLCSVLATVLALWDGPLHAAVPADTLYVTNSGANTVSKVDEATGLATTFATGLDDPFGIVLAPNGDFYVANEANSAPGGFGTISQITASGSVSQFAVIGETPDGLAVNSAGDLFAVNFSSGTISEVPTTGPDAGMPTTFVTGLSEPTGDAFSPNGTLYVAEATGSIYTISLTGSATLFASPGENPTGLAFDSGTNLYLSGLSNGVIYTYSPAVQENPFASGFSDPEGLAFDSDGNLLVADLGNSSGGGSASSEITILNSGGGFIENITGFTDPAYFVDASIPEPSSWVMFAAGAAVLLVRRSRRKPTSKK